MSRSYYVHFIDDDPPVVHGPYAGTKAQFLKTKRFAMIGSRYGGRRLITRGRTGPPVRIYEQGERRWPRGEAEVAAAGLLPMEEPRVASPRLPPALREQESWVANPGAWVDPVFGKPGLFNAYYREVKIGIIHPGETYGEWVGEAQHGGHIIAGYDFDKVLGALRAIAFGEMTQMLHAV